VDQSVVLLHRVSFIQQLSIVLPPSRRDFPILHVAKLFRYKISIHITFIL
jgi:hypothetical protein